MSDYTKNMGYCPKCGYITPFLFKTCLLCDTPLFEINPKWEITQDKREEFLAQERYGEKTYVECVQEFYDYCKPFYEEILTKRPEFDQKLFNTLIERQMEHRNNLKKRRESWDKQVEEHREFMEKYGVDTPPRVECPYCHSTNTKKISGVERATSVGLFGLLSKKIGKSWKCNSCGSTW